MANPGSSSQLPAGPTQAQAPPPVASFIPVPPRLEMKNGPNPTTWRVWAQQWKAFVAVSRLDAQSDEHQCGMLTSAVDDETLRIIGALPYTPESDRKKPDKPHRPSWKILSTGLKHYVRTPPVLPTTAKGRGNRRTFHYRPAYVGQDL